MNDNSQKLTEGVYDPGVLKAIFLAGGGGSGKSRVSQEILGIPVDGTKKGQLNLAKFSSTGLKVMSSDIAFEKYLDDAHIKKNLEDLRLKDPRAYNKAMHLRDKAVRVTRAKKGHAFDGRLGVVIDGTARNFVTVKEDKKKLQRMGYDTFMIFVDTTLETALRRNKERGARGDREVAEPVVIEAWHSAQQNKVRYSQLFGSNMIIVDNSIDRAEHVKLPPDVYVAATHFMAKPLKNPIGKQWVAMELDAKRRGSVHESVLSEIHRDHMPQIQQDTIKDTLRHFKEQGVEYRIELVPASALKPTQENFSTMKVTGMVPMVDELLKQLVFISKDNYLLDGHHRWMAVKQGLGDNTKMRAVRILLDKTEALVQLKIAERDVPMNEVAIFPGRFSPFHPGHYSVYESLVGRFGQDNVYIATSGVTNESSSPFNFDQKKINFNNPTKSGS